MMPDLGIYATHVIAAYTATMILLMGIVADSVFRSNRVGRTLERLEMHQVEKSDG